MWPHGLQPTRLLCPWNSLGKNTGVGGHFLLQRIFPTQGSNLSLLHCRWILTTEPPGKPSYTRYISSLFMIVSPIGHCRVLSSSLCYTEGPHCSSILYIVLCIRQRQYSILSLSSPGFTPFFLTQKLDAKAFFRL